MTLLGSLAGLFPDGGGERFADIGGTLHAMNSRGGHGFVFFLGRARTAADDRAGVAHAAAGRRGLPGDETDDGFFYVRVNVLRGLLLGISADFTDQDDGARVGVFVK